MTSLRSILALVALTVFCALPIRAHAADPAPAPAPAAPAAPAEPAPAAAAETLAVKREDLEPKTLTEALNLLKTARADRDRAETGLTTEQSAHAKNKALLKSTLEIATKHKADLDTANTNLATVTKERDTERAAHTGTKETLTLAESALGVHGVTSTAAVSAARDNAATGGLLDKFLAEPSPGARAAMLCKDGNAIYAEAKARGVKIG